MPEPLLEVRDLTVRFRGRQGYVTAVDNLSFTVMPGEVLGIVGESGSGKSVTCMALMRLITSQNVEISGEAAFRGQDLLSVPQGELQRIRGAQIAMVFQDPMTSLTPVYTAGWHISEQIRAHEKVSKKAARARAIELLGEVGIPQPEKRVDSYPHEFSGGMRQRVVIAMALSCNPALLIADEPTTALDVTIQAQILDLMRRLRAEHGSSIMIVTHDMGVVSQIADRMLVMYGGRAAETGTCREVFNHPRHPYTWGLLSSVPRTDRPRTRRLATIPGSPISPSDPSTGCRFAPRCLFAMDECAQQPPLTESAPGHLDACWLPDDRDRLREQAETAAQEARA